MSRPLLAASVLLALVVVLAGRAATAADAPPDFTGAWAFAEDLTGGGRRTRRHGPSVRGGP
jgi:hypothetical protein